MKYFLVLGIAVMMHAPGVAAQSKDASSIKNIRNDNTIAGTWLLQPVLASDTASGKIPELSFNLTTKKFSGNTGCNNMHGNFMISRDSLSFNEQVFMTEMACVGYNEKAFIENFSKTNRYKIVNGVLQLMSDQTVLSKWVRKEEVKKTRTI